MRYAVRARPTLHAVEMDRGDELAFTRSDGRDVRIRLVATGAEIVSTTLDASSLPLIEQRHAVTNYRFWCDLEIDGQNQRIEREVATQRSFYEPLEAAGLSIYFDACDDIFTFLRDTHGGCAPRRQARFAIHEADHGICPEPLHPWCPLPKGHIDVADCYNGEDVWLGAYFGASAHGGLDINHPPGTPIWAPLEFHEHGYFNSLAKGDKNNRHRGVHHWPDGSSWVLQCHHMTSLLVPEDRPVRTGEAYASGAGVYSGSHHHSHFVFRVRDEQGESLLDPWIIFRQILRDRVPEPRGAGR
jgi:hypothetical protein